MELVTDSHGATDVGRVRDANEDQFLIADLTKSMLIQQTSLSHDDGHRLYGGSQGHLYVVADGMGGHRAGDVASGVAVDTLASYFVAMIPWLLQAETDSVDELEDAGKTPFRSSLSQVVGGGEAEIQPDVHHASVAAGDTILLCTDGLTREVSEDDIAAILSDDNSAEEICTRLIDAANQAGGADNITVVVSRVLEEA